MPHIREPQASFRLTHNVRIWWAVLTSVWVMGPITWWLTPPSLSFIGYEKGMDGVLRPALASLNSSSYSVNLCISAHTKCRGLVAIVVLRLRLESALRNLFTFSRYHTATIWSMRSAPIKSGKQRNHNLHILQIIAPDANAAITQYLLSPWLHPRAGNSQPPNSSFPAAQRMPTPPYGFHTPTDPT
jgi:hypothetical protein